MTAPTPHDHAERVHGCFRCETGADEAAAEAERRLLETAEWVPMDLDKMLRPPPAIIRTSGGLVLDWGWRRLVLGRRAWLPMGHPTPTWRLGPVAYYGTSAWDGSTEGAAT